MVWGRSPPHWAVPRSPDPTVKHVYSYLSGLAIVYLGYGGEALLHSMVWMIVARTLAVLVTPYGAVFNVWYKYAGIQRSSLGIRNVPRSE